VPTAYGVEADIGEMDELLDLGGDYDLQRMLSGRTNFDLVEEDGISIEFDATHWAIDYWVTLEGERA
jgi:hypothetical protein